MIILLDAGHGESTPGKRSPDGRLREYKYCREIANEVKKQLTDKGFDVELVVTDEVDVPLMQRCRIVNQYCDIHGKLILYWCQFTVMLLVAGQIG